MKIREQQQLSLLLVEARAVAGDLDPLAIAVAIPSLRCWLREGRTDVIDWLHINAPIVTLIPLAAALRCVNQNAMAEDFDHADPYLCEKLLSFTAGQQRRRQGAFYTPRPLANYLVRRIDHALQEQFGLAEGLADTSTWEALYARNVFTTIPAQVDPQQPFVQLLDPALGSGVFMMAVLEHVYTRLAEQGQDHTWSDAVSSLLPRMLGWELTLPALVSAVMQLAGMLAKTGFDFRRNLTIPWQQRDALAPMESACAATIVLGNPPYASLSTAQHGWLEAMISHPASGYTTLHGEPLGEKKHWLHDDYVKFIRLAQWQVEQVGCGVVGLVTNHGYLENVSFRGMRASLCQTFPQLEIVDLQGNAKNRTAAQTSSRDENVFGIASGVALNLLVRPPDYETTNARIIHHSLRGSRLSKLERLENGELGVASELHPTTPLYLFAPQRAMASPAYEASPSLCDIMPFRASAPVTARDHFTVAFTAEELLQRLAEFRDLSIPDATIRTRYFQRTRSSRYPTGDSRSWKLATSRKQLADDPAWASSIRPVQYRPFDVRYIAWHEALLDWPRPEFARQMLAGPNVALIARRQSPAHQPANFFWATSLLTLDGILRSDNRGNESLFPLWLYDAAGQASPNLSPDWVGHMERITQLHASPRALLAYIYGCLFSHDYRTANHSSLVHDYPRIPFPADAETFIACSQRGEALLSLHLKQFVGQAPACHIACSGRQEPALQAIAKGYPIWKSDKIWINADTVIAEIDAVTWNFTIGTHQVARKWLKDRVGRSLTESDIASYQHLLQQLQMTREV